MLSLAGVKTWFGALMGGANLWFMVALIGAGIAIGGASAWKIASWKESAKWTQNIADTNKTLNESAKTLVDALDESEMLRAEQIETFNLAIKETQRVNAETQTSVAKVLTRIQGINNAINEVEKRALVIAVGLCNFDPAADGVRDEAYRAAFPAADSSTSGEAGSEHAADPKARSTDATRGAIPKRTGAGSNARLRESNPGGG